MRKQWGVFGAVLAVACVLTPQIGVIAQTVTQRFDKVLIRSTANDALAMLGGISANGAISTTASFNGGPFVTLSATAPLYQWVESDAATDNKSWREIVDGTVYRLQAFNDTGSVINDAIAVTRSGATVTGIALGTSGTPFAKILSATATWDPNNLSATDGFDSVLLTMTGVTSGSPCMASFTATLGTLVSMEARYDSANSVRVILTNNNTGSPYDPLSGTVRATCVVY